jgi:hypothetical protein
MLQREATGIPFGLEQRADFDIAVFKILDLTVLVVGQRNAAV